MAPVSKETELDVKKYASQVEVEKVKGATVNREYNEKNIYNDGEILKQVLEVTLGASLNKAADPQKNKVVEFLHPQDLQVSQKTTSFY